MNQENNTIQWYLEGELKDNSPWIIAVSKSPFFIGRHEASDLILSSTSVSRKHAELDLDRGDLYITDLNSKNGISINGKQQTSRSLLHEGDLLKIGTSEFTVSTNLSALEDVDEQTLVKKADRTQISFSDLYALSEREYEVLFFLVKGDSLKKIGECLYISTGTVKNHVLKIYKKTGCHSRIELSTKYSEYKGKK